MLLMTQTCWNTCHNWWWNSGVWLWHPNESVIVPVEVFGGSNYVPTQNFSWTYIFPLCNNDLELLIIGSVSLSVKNSMCKQLPLWSRKCKKSPAFISIFIFRGYRFCFRGLRIYFYAYELHYTRDQPAGIIFLWRLSALSLLMAFHRIW